MIAPKAQKLLALALDSAAAPGEWKNAATAFVGLLRKAGTTATELLAPPVPAFTQARPGPPPRWTPPPSSNPFETKMPFGCHKGKPLSKIPTDYLHWVLTLPDLRPDLRRAIQSELESR